MLVHAGRMAYHVIICCTPALPLRCHTVSLQAPRADPRLKACCPALSASSPPRARDSWASSDVNHHCGGTASPWLLMCCGGEFPAPSTGRLSPAHAKFCCWTFLSHVARHFPAGDYPEWVRNSCRLAGIALDIAGPAADAIKAAAAAVECQQLTMVPRLASSGSGQQGCRSSRKCASSREASFRWWQIIAASSCVALIPTCT